MPIPKKKRKCLICNQEFKPMTDKKWKNVRHLHENQSIKHQKALARIKVKREKHS